MSQVSLAEFSVRSETESVTPLQRARLLKCSLERLLMPVVVPKWFEETQLPDYMWNVQKLLYRSNRVLLLVDGRFCTATLLVLITVAKFPFTNLTIELEIRFIDLPVGVEPRTAKGGDFNMRVKRAPNRAFDIYFSTSI